MDFLFPRDFRPFGLSGVSVRAIRRVGPRKLERWSKGIQAVSVRFGLLSSFVLARSTQLCDFSLLRLFRRVGPDVSVRANSNDKARLFRQCRSALLCFRRSFLRGRLDLSTSRIGSRLVWASFYANRAPVGVGISRSACRSAQTRTMK